MPEREDWNWIVSAWRGRAFRATFILALSTPWLLIWKYFGSIDFYQRAIHPGWPICQDLFTAAATYQFLACFVMLALIPMLVVKLVFRQRLADYGWRFGTLRRTLFSLLLLGPVFVLIGYLSADDPALRSVYPVNRSLLGSRQRQQTAPEPPVATSHASQKSDSADQADRRRMHHSSHDAELRRVPATAWPRLFAFHAVCYLLFYIGWEFYFRGFMLIGLEESLGRASALLLQVMASCLLHIGSPASETFGAILGGLLWGLLAFRTRSLLSGLAQHYLLGISLDWFICTGGY